MGILKLRYGKLRVYDLSGLFFRSLPRPADRDILLLPRPERPVPFPKLPDGETAGKRLRPKHGGGFAEEHDIREYRAGDPLNAVHWKLSAKLDELLIREPLVADRGELRLLMDLFGSRDTLESVFGKLTYIGGELLRRMLPFSVYFCDREGTPQGVRIDSHEALEAFMRRRICTGLPRKREINPRQRRKRAVPRSGLGVFPHAGRRAGGAGMKILHYLGQLVRRHAAASVRRHGCNLFTDERICCTSGRHPMLFVLSVVFGGLFVPVPHPCARQAGLCRCAAAVRRLSYSLPRAAV